MCLTGLFVGRRGQLGARQCNECYTIRSSAMRDAHFDVVFQGWCSVTVNGISCGQIDADKSCAKWLQNGSNELTKDVVGIHAEGRASPENPDSPSRDFRDSATETIRGATRCMVTRGGVLM